MNEKMKKYELNATTLLRSTNSGILSTISKAYRGYPFGSYVTFITGPDRSIYIYASTLAQHTKNLFKDPKACITLSREKKDDDKQNSQRLTLMGDLEPLNDNDKEYIKNRFHTFLPESKKYSTMHDFDFYKLSLHKIRWIGGFGEIAWAALFWRLRLVHERVGRWVVSELAMQTSCVRNFVDLQR